MIQIKAWLSKFATNFLMVIFGSQPDTDSNPDWIRIFIKIIIFGVYEFRPNRAQQTRGHQFHKHLKKTCYWYWHLLVTEPVSFHGLMTVSATEASLLLDPEYGMLYLQNSDMPSALNSLGANWSRICLSRALNHGALWHIDFLCLRNILTYLPTYCY